jgi:2-iminobutanoate/2-iminopropanoate deaminase
MQFQRIATLFSILISLTPAAAQTTSAINFINNVPNATTPFGAYSQGVSVDLTKGKLIFVSGQFANDPKTHKPIENDIELATRQALNNIDTILKAAGSDLNHVVCMDVLLRDLKDWNGMNKEYAKHFANGHFPARQATQVGIIDRIEISCIAYVPNE